MALKLAQIVATGNGVFKLVSMFEDATAAAASAPQTGQTERNINKYKRQEKMDVYFKDQVVLKHFFSKEILAETPTTISAAEQDGDCDGKEFQRVAADERTFPSFQVL